MCISLTLNWKNKYNDYENIEYKKELDNYNMEDESGVYWSSSVLRSLVWEKCEKYWLNLCIDKLKSHVKI